MRLESYAQELEDLIIYAVVRDVPDGFYIDVGANDPTHISVTKFFYDRGWHGINIEPLRFRCLLLEEMRPRDINLCVGAGNRKGKLSMFGADGLATFSDETVKQHSYHENAAEGSKTILTLTEIFRKHCKPNQQVHFCKIDVEGYEREVLEGIQDWDEFRPWMFVMEATLPGTAIPCHDKWEDILLKNDYIMALAHGINRYYIDKQKEHLLNRVGQIVPFLRQHELAILKMMPISLT